MNLDTGYLLSSLFISCIGMGYFLYGKKASRLVPLFAGIILSAYPFFVSNLWLMWGIAAAVITGTYFIREQ